jgi:restriction system protein
MPVPTYDKFIEPVLRYLAAHPEGAPAREVHEAAAQTLDLTDADRAELLPSGVQHVFKNRAGWAHDRLKRSGLSSSSRRGYWQLTEKGRDFARTHPPPLPPKVLEKIAVWHNDVRLRPENQARDTPEVLEQSVMDRATVSPDDRLEQAVTELRQGVIAELLEMLAQVSPQYFETVVLDLLHRMGYGTSRADLVRVGRSGDGGIDGVISLDRLGLEKVYVQAKRWQNSVGRPDVQGFFGAIAGNHATKGVFITTSSFSPQAVAYAGTVEGVVLVDGAKLAELMIEHEVGVSSRPVRVPRIDSDYFEE